MPTDHRSVLARIKRFDQLIAYLRDEMGWPIDNDDFEELTFEYTPEELGIDSASAAKIQGIRRLRPLSPNQPWGIFFIKFEPKQLPVVALRRILSRVALKKRASSNSAERAAWAADDLLFVSNFGDGNERQISFAHFSQDRAKGDLPILKVLGWNDRDTALHLDGVVAELTTKLSWPDDESNAEGWREKWRSAFTLRPDEVIKTSKALAVELAKLARRIRDRLRTSLSIENEKGAFTRLLTAFRQALIHDLSAEGFADMYAQTIAYGLLSARVTNPGANTARGFATELPVTNPFLKDLMETFLHIGGRKEQTGYGPSLDFDELGVGDVVELLDEAKMDAVVRDFGDQMPAEDPVTHFYELFLNEFDQETKKRRGVFYTPRPVVSYIVRSVHKLLQDEFGLVDGLADAVTWGEMAEREKNLKVPTGVNRSDPFVAVLDPATGTGTFLVEVIDVIHRTLVERWKGEGREKTIPDLWNEYVPKHLLPRLCGYELLMAPYAIAHLKIGLKLYETGYRFGSSERARIYLTNALEPATDTKRQIEFKELIPALAHEAEAVSNVKSNCRFTVVIGNPPYSNVGQLNRIPFIMDLLEDYKRGLNERKLNLDDDFIKFIRLCQHLLQTSGQGILGFITNNVYLDGLTHRRMRRSLLDAFPDIRIVNLHGSLRRQERSPDGSRDENVFDIQQGVCVAVMSRRPDSGRAVVRYADLWGSRTGKYSTLEQDSLRFRDLEGAQLADPKCFFVPQDNRHPEEYAAYPSLTALFHIAGQGIQTKQDGFALQASRQAIGLVIEDLKRLSVKEISAKYSIPEVTPSWSIAWAKRDVTENPGEALRIVVKPFDWRWTYFTGHSNGFLARPRGESTRLMAKGNLALVAKRQTKEARFSSIFVVNVPVNEGVFSIDPKGRETLFPLKQVPLHSGDMFVGIQGQANINDALFSEALRGRAPEEKFQYLYALLNSPMYRERYSEYLKIDFPRLPTSGSADLFRSLALLGGELIGLHLMDSPSLDQPITTYAGQNHPEVGRVAWSEGTVWLDGVTTRKGQRPTTGTSCFRGVPELVWNFHVGGYQVCEKWLKDRKGRTLSKEEVIHYQKIVVALAETIRVMKEIDEVIEDHGGWPGAFRAGDEARKEPPLRKVAEERQEPYRESDVRNKR